MILNTFTTIAAAVSLYIGSSIIVSNVDVFYVFIIVQTMLVVFIKIAHHSSESSVRIDKAGGLFVFFTSSATLLYGLQVITTSIIFKGI